MWNMVFERKPEAATAARGRRGGRGRGRGRGRGGPADSIPAARAVADDTALDLGEVDEGVEQYGDKAT